MNRMTCHVKALALGGRGTILVLFAVGQDAVRATDLADRMPSALATLIATSVTSGCSSYREPRPSGWGTRTEGNLAITRRTGTARDSETFGREALSGPAKAGGERVSAAAGERRRRVAGYRKVLRNLA